MVIEEIVCIPQKNDGTIIIKTEVDNPQVGLQYCWYIYKGSERVYNSSYRSRSYLLYTAEEYGKYQIKAFVRTADKSERAESVTSYVVTKENAKDLHAAQMRKSTQVLLRDQLAEERILLAEVVGPTEEGDRFAWYVFAGENEEPVFKMPYSENPVFAYRAEKPGTYYLKAFCTRKQDKWSLKSAEITL